MTKSKDRVTKSNDKMTKSTDRVTKPKDKLASGSTWGRSRGLWADSQELREGPRQISGLKKYSFPNGKNHETSSDFFCWVLVRTKLVSNQFFAVFFFSGKSMF